MSIEFPVESDFTQGGEEFTEAIANLRGVISNLNDLKPGDFPPRTTIFVEKTLPAIWKTIRSTQYVNRALLREIQELTEHLCFLVVHLDLNPKLVQAIASSFDDSMKGPEIYEIQRLKVGQMNEAQRLPAGKALRQGKPPAKQLISNLLSDIVTSGIFSKMKDMAAEKAMNVNIMAPLCQLFVAIQRSVSELFVSFALPVMIQTCIDVLRLHGADYNGICQFVTWYARMVPWMLDSIIASFCELAVRGGSVKTSFAVVNYIVQVVRACGIGKSAAAVKNALIGAVSAQAHQSVIRQVLEFLPDLADKSINVKFTDRDLGDLMFKSRSGEELRADAIAQIVARSSDSKFDMFARQLVESAVFHPTLYCALIENVESEDVSRELFGRLLTCNERSMKCNLASVSPDQRLRMHIDEVMNGSKDISAIASLSFFFLNAPHLDSLPEFIFRILDLTTEYPQLFPVLSDFSRVLNDFESEKAFMALFDAVFANITGRSEKSPYGNSMICVFSEWVECSKRIPSEKIFKRMLEIDFSQCSRELPPIIDCVISKCTEKDSIVKFLIKILRDTVPPIYARWLIDALFRHIGTKQSSVNEVVQILIDALDSEETFTNAAFLIVEAIKREVDFYGLFDEFGLCQNIKFIEEDREIERAVSLHPFHSTRRIYVYSANLLDRNISHMKVSANDGSEDKPIHEMMPMEAVRLNPTGILTMEVRVDKDEKNNLPPVVKPMFMKGLSSEARLSAIFARLVDDGSIVSELFFLVLVLFGEPKAAPITHLQNLLCGKCDNPFVFEDSIRMFPFALKAMTDQGITLSCEDTERMLDVVMNHYYDKTSLAIICYAIPRVGSKFCFSSDMVRRCLLKSRDPMYRDSVGSLVSPETSHQAIIGNISMACMEPYRFRSKQFFECARMFEFPKEVFIPFYLDLVQAEKSHYADPDETFIALLSLIPLNEELVSVTLDRLFSAPSCRYINVPFVHTYESWSAALTYLMTEMSIPKLSMWLGTLRAVLQTGQKLSDDFTYVGRLGIQNLGSTCYVNSLLQILNVFDHISLKLVARETSGLNPFIQELRYLLAQLRFTRGQVLSIQRLVETIPDFKVSVQEDAEEFLNMLVNKLGDELDDPKEITDHIRGQLTTSIHANNSNEVLSSTSEDFFYLSLPTQGCSTLAESFSAYFEDEILEGGYMVDGQAVPASRRVEVTRYPDYLVIQLQRWEFAIETGERNKLVHEVGFPVDLQGLPVSYELAGVVVHQGSADQGHYTTVVQDDDGEWYLCNDQSVQYFDVKDLASWAFGIADEVSGVQEDVSTGYLLFYKRRGMEKMDVVVPKDLEDELNNQNAMVWPSTVFYSRLFVNYVKDLVQANPQNRSAINLGLTVFFKIALIDDGSKQDDEDEDPLLIQWEQFLTENILTKKESCMIFFEYIDTDLGDSLIPIITLSDRITRALSNVITHAFGKLLDTTEPLRIMIKYMKTGAYRKQCLLLALDLIYDACKDLKVDWSSEEDVLLMLLDFLSMPMSKDLKRQISKSYNNAFNSLMEMLSEMVERKGCTEVILQTFDIDRLNVFCSAGKRSEGFANLLQCVSTLRPDLFHDLSEASQSVKAFLALAIPAATPAEPDEQIEVDLGFMWPSVTTMLFCDKRSLRAGCKEILERAIHADPAMQKYLKLAIVDPSLTRPQCSEIHSLAVFVASLLPQMAEKVTSGHAEFCREYVSVLHHLSFASPKCVCLQASVIVDVIQAIGDPDMLLKLFEIIRNIVAFDSSIMDAMPETAVSVIMNARFASPDIVQLLVAFRSCADRSALSGACVEYYFGVEEDDGALLLIELLENGLIPGDFLVPRKAVDLTKLRFVNALWNVLDERRVELSKYMLSALRRAKPLALFRNSKTIHATCEILEAFCGENLEELLANAE